MQTVRYIRERRCVSGGYCFYRLDEPNAADTFWALSALSFGSVLPHDPATEEFLLNLQNDSGGYANVFVGYYTTGALALLGRTPLRDPGTWLSTLLERPLEENRPIESGSICESFACAVTIADILRIPVPDVLKDRVITLIRSLQKPDGGFGQEYATLVETSHALTILTLLNQPIHTSEILGFLNRCDNQDSGFVNVPDTSQAYLEHVYAGMVASSLLKRRPSHTAAVTRFLAKCLTETGGYRRSVFGGTPTLEYTYSALHSRAIMDQFAKNCCD